MTAMKGKRGVFSGNARVTALLLVLAIAAVFALKSGDVLTGRVLDTGTENQPPQWVGSTNVFTAVQDAPVVLSLNELFSDPEGKSLTFIASDTENLSIDLQDNTLTITPEPGFSGERMISIVASDGTQVSRQRIKVEVGSTTGQPAVEPQEQPSPPAHSAVVRRMAKIEQALADAVQDGNTVDAIIVLNDTIPFEFSAKATRQEKRTALDNVKARVRRNREALLANVNTNSITGAAVSGNDFVIIRQYDTINAIAVRITRAGLESLRNNPAVSQVVADRKFKAGLSQSVPLINASSVWGVNVNGQNITGQGQAICIIDTGIDVSHSAFTGKVLSGYDYINNDANPQDDAGNSHGTHVSGIASGNSTAVKGVAPDSLIVPVKVCNNNGDCDGNAILAGIDYCNNNAVAFNISVISGSLGDNAQYNSTTCPAWFDSALSTSVSLGIIPVFASGNNGFTSGINYPACSPYAISVGSTSKADAMESYTNRGGDRLDLLAPGGSIVSSVIGGGTGSLSGTSMATPHVSGAVALIQQNELAHGRSALTLAQMKQVLQITGVDVSGYKRIDVLVAVNERNDNISINLSENSVSNNVPPKAKVVFKDATVMDGIDSCADISYNFVSIDTVACPQFNKAARITFEGMPIANFRILRDGEPCTEEICQNITFDEGNISFDVTEFSNYSINSSFGTNSGGCPLSLTVDTVLDSDGSSTTTCFTFNGNNIALDCDGHTATFNTGGGDFGYGVYASNKKNLIIKNCNFKSGSTGGNWVYGVYFNGVNYSTVYNNNITNAGTQNSKEHSGILIANAQQIVNVTSNWVNISGNNSIGISFTGALAGANMRVVNNTILTRATGTGTQNNGIWIGNTDNCLVTGNNIILNDSADSQGLYFGGLIEYGTVENNSIIVQGKSSNNIGISIDMLVKNINFTGNSINVNGTTNTHGIDLYYTTGHQFRFTNITTAGTSAHYGIYAFESNATFNKTRIENSRIWAYVYEFNFLSKVFFDNTTFATPYGSINVLKNFTMDYSFEELNNSDVNVTLNRSYMRSTRPGVKLLNQSSIITLNGLGTSFGSLRVDYEDDGTYAACPSSVCNLLSSSGGTVVFNVSHFTTFGANMTTTSVSCNSCADCTTCTGTQGNTCTLSTDISASSTCVTVGNDNVTINCDGKTITFNTGVGGTDYGITATSRKNITVVNCTIISAASSTGAIPVYLYQTNSSRVLNSILTSNSSSGLYLGAAFYNVITGNKVNATNPNGNAGIRIAQKAQYNNITANTVITNGTIGTNYGISSDFESPNNTISDNLVVSGGSGIANYGIYVIMGDNRIVNNSVNTTGDQQNHGIVVNGDNSIIANNSIRATGISIAQYGIYVLNGVQNTFENNNILVLGGANSNGIYLGTGANRNTFLLNNISANGTNTYAIYIDASISGSNFSSTIINDTPAWIYTGAGASNNFSNTTFRMSSGSINILPFMQLNGSQDITKAKLNISQYKAFLNSTSLPYFNTSAIITLYGITGTNPEPVVDYEDDNTYIMCPAGQCTELSYTPGVVYVFNTTHFTQYTTNDIGDITSCPVTINYSTTLTQSLTSTDTCITIGNESVTLDCAGYNITYNTNGGNSEFGIVSTGYNNLVIKNCNIRDTNSAGDYGIGINLTYVNDSVITNSNITINGSYFNYGIYTINSSRNRIENNTITARCTDTNNYGIYLFRDSSGSTISRNTIITNSSDSATAVRIDVKSVNNSVIFNNISAIAGEAIYVNQNSERANITGNTISVIENTGLVNVATGIYLYTGSHNSTISNNTIVTDSTAELYARLSSGLSITDNRFTKNGGWLASGYHIKTDYSNLSLISNNAGFNTVGGLNAAGISMSYAFNNTITRNNLTTNASGGGGIEISGSRNAVYDNQVLTIKGTRGLYITGDAINNYFEGNNVTVNSSGGNGMAAYVYAGINNTIRNNNLDIYGNSSRNTGVYFYAFMAPATGNIIDANNITVNGTGGNYGIYFYDSCDNNTFSNNTIRVYGNESGNAVLYLQNTRGNNFTANTIYTLINNTVMWINSTSGSSNNFTNTTFAMPNGSINILPGFNLTGVHQILKKNINISDNKAFLNSSNLTFLNTTAIITLNGVSFSDPKPMVDYEDDGSYIDCPTSQCTELSYAGTTYVFNTTRFTSYRAADGGTAITSCPVTINESYTLTQNIASNDTCITLNNSNIELNCAGYSIFYNANGTDAEFGIASTGHSNITIKNCNIRDTNSTGNNGFGINFSYGNDSIITNTNITTNGSQFSNGMNIVIDSNRNTITNSTIMTFGINSYGIYLLYNSSGNNITGNTIQTNDSDSYAIYLLNSITDTIIGSNNITAVGSAIVITTDSSRNNISDNNITSIYTTGSRYGISITNSENNTIKNNIVLAQDANINLAYSTGNIITGNRLTINTTFFTPYVAYWASTNNTLFSNNTLTTVSDGCWLMRINGFNNNNIVSSNTFLSNNITSYSNNGGIVIDGGLNNTFAYNTITGYFGGVGIGFIISSNTNYTHISNNNISLLGASSHIGIKIGSQASNQVSDSQIIENNQITLNATSSQGIFLTWLSTNNTFRNNKITTTGANSYGVYIGTSNSSFFNSTTINSSQGWIMLFANTMNNFTNTTFMTPNGTISILPLIQLNGSIEINNSKLNITSNRAFLNSTNLTYFNTSAIITLYGISYIDPKAQVDYADSGSYADCPTSQCTDLSYTGTTYVFNTTRFTSYRAADGGTAITSCPVTINESTTLTQNLVSNTSCIVINNSNTILDCNGYNITFNQKGGTDFGINASNVTNIVIRNCTIIEANITGGSTGIYLQDVSNSTIAYNNVTVNGSFSSVSNGIQMSSSTGLFTSNNNTVANNTIHIFDLTGSYGILINYQNENHKILGNRINVVNGTPISIVWYANNLLIAGNQVRLAAGGASIGIGLANTNHSLFENNTVEFGSPGAGYRGITISSDSNYNTVSANNFSSTMEKSGPGAIVIQANNNYAINNIINISGKDCEGIIVSAINNTVTGNNITENCNITAKGIYLSNAKNNTLAYNNITATGPDTGVTAISSYGTYLTSSSYNNITQNSISVNGTSSNYGIYLQLTNYNNTIWQNSIAANGDTNNNYGLLVNRSAENNFTGNSIITNGVSNNHAIVIDGASGYGELNRFSLNNLSTSGTSSFGIMITNANNTLFNSTLLNNTVQWINTSSNTFNNFTNTTFEMPYGSINIPVLAEINGSQDITKAKLAITYLYAFLNSTNISALNASGIITLNSVAFTNPKPMVDYDDNGGYEFCPPSQCAELGYSGGTFVYNTTHFTVYSALESSIAITSCPVTINESTTLAQNLVTSSNKTCITINSSNMVLDCNGSTILYATNATNNTHAIFVYRQNNVTIRNCNMMSVNGSLAFSIAINLTNASNVWMENNRITTNGTIGNKGVAGVSAHNITFINNTVRTGVTDTPTTSGSGNTGFVLSISADNSYIANNTVVACCGSSISGISGYTNSTMINNLVNVTGTAASSGVWGYHDSRAENNKVIVRGWNVVDGVLVSGVGPRIINNTVEANGTNNVIGLDAGGSLIDGGTIANNNVTIQGTSYVYGVWADTNNTIENNTIRAYSTGATNYGFYVNSNSTIRNNTLTMNGTSSCEGIRDRGDNRIIGNTLTISHATSDNVIIYAYPGTTLQYNNFVINGSGSTNVGLDISYNDNFPEVLGNNISIRGSDTTKGIYTSGQTNITVRNNNITITAGSANNYAVHLDGSVAGANIGYNSITASGADQTYGIALNGDITSENNITGNNITITEGGFDSAGLALTTTGTITGQKVRDNNINITASGGTGIFLGNATTNTLTGNNVTSTDGYAVFIVGGGANSFANTSLTDPKDWLLVGSGSSGNTFIRTLFAQQQGSIFIFPSIMPDNTDATKARLNITSNLAFMNSTNLQTLNTSAIITLNGIAFVNPKPVVDYEDDSSFIDCPAEQCVELGYAGGTYTFNTTHFTGYSTQESGTVITGCPVTINSSYTLTQNLTSNDTCITIGNSSMVLDCAGYGIFYNANGTNAEFGIAVNSVDNITIKNCFIRDINLTGAFCMGINLTNTSNSTLLNNTVITNGTNDNYGILYMSILNTNRVLNNTVSTFGSAASNIGIFLYGGSGVGNNITGNNITTNGTAANYGLGITVGANRTMVADNTIATSGSSSSNDAVNLFNTAGNNITGNNITAHGDSAGSGVKLNFNANDNIISNNRISSAGSADSNHGVYIREDSARNNITGNNITTNGTGTNYGIFLEISANNNIINRNIVSPGGSADFNMGIYLKQLSSGNTITNNNVTTNRGSNNNYGISITNGTNNTISSNIVSTNATGDLNYGIYFYDQASGNSITNNNITTNGGSNSNDGIGFSSNTNDNIIRGNKITAGGRASYNNGISLYSSALRNNITNNEISTSGTEHNTAIILENSAENNIFYNNTITTSGNYSYAIEIINSNYSTFNSTMMNNTVEWINATENTFNNFTNTTFAMPDGSINIPFLAQVNGLQDITKSRLEITTLFAFLNSTNITTLNTSAIITFYGVSFANPRPLVDYEDDSSYIICPANQCVELSYTGTTYAFNTTHFTGYTLEETTEYNFSNMTIRKLDNPDPVNANSNLAYQINVSSTGNGTAYNVTVNDTYPPQATYLTAQPAPMAGTNNYWVLGNLTPGTNISINVTLFVLNVLNNTIINNTANMSYQNETGALLQLGAFAETTVNSRIVDSNVTNSTIINCTVINSTIINSNKTDCVIINSIIINSNNTNTTLIDSNETNSTDNNAIVYNSTIIDSIKTNTNVTNSTLISSNKTDSTVTNSYVINSTNINSTLINSNETNSTDINSTVDNSIIINATKINSIINGSNITNSTINSTIVINSSINSSNLTNCTVTNSTLNGINNQSCNYTNYRGPVPAPGPSGGGGGGGGGGIGGVRRNLTQPVSGGGQNLCIESWACEEWSRCDNEMQSRECVDLYHCNTTALRPAIERKCTMPVVAPPVQEQPTGETRPHSTLPEPQPLEFPEEKTLWARITGITHSAIRLFQSYMWPIIFVVLGILLLTGAYIGITRARKHEEGEMPAAEPEEAITITRVTAKQPGADADTGALLDSLKSSGDALAEFEKEMRKLRK